MVAKKLPPEIKVAYKPWMTVRPDGKWVGQAVAHHSKARFRVVMAGRQSGKTMLGISEICLDAMAIPGHVNWWVTQNSKVMPRVVRGIGEFLPPEIIKHKSERVEPRFELTNGSVIFIKSADAEDSLVSESLDFAVCDEAGLWKETAFDRGIRPMFLARPEFRALLIGTPRGKNWFHRAYLRGLSGDNEWASFHWKSEDSPFTSKEELAAVRRETSIENYMQEYEADPLDNAAAVFRNFRSCIRPLAQHDNFTVLGVDLARKLDFSAMIGMNGARNVCHIERFQEDWSEQKRKIAGKAFGWNARVVIDATGIGDVFVEELRNHGVQTEGYIISSQSKQKLIDNLKVAFEQGTIGIPNDAVLLEEIEAYEYEYDDETRRYKYSAPEGKHDDLVIALALATWGQRGAMAIAASSNASSYMRGRGNSSYLRRA